MEFAWRVDLFKPQKADSSLSCYLKPEINVANFPWVGVLTKLVGKYHSFKLTRRPTHPSHRTAPRKTLDFTFFHDAKLTSSIILIIPFNWPGGHPPHLKDLHNASVGDTITRVWSKKSIKTDAIAGHFWHFWQFNNTFSKILWKQKQKYFEIPHLFW